MRIVLIGAGGQLGTALSVRLAGQVIPLGRDVLDLTNLGSIRETLPQARPDVVINAAAYNFVDRAEEEPDRAFAVNAVGPKSLAEVCATLDVPLVHVSTDYVFGSKLPGTIPFRESDVPAPSSEYARGKLAGESFVQSACTRHFIVRTCGLYGRASSPGKGNFVETMLRLGKERGAVSVVDDQWCTPTAAADLGGAIADLIATDKYGLYHATNSGSTTWCRFAREIFRCAGMAVEVTPITTAQFGASAPRPNYSVFDNSKLTAAIGRSLRPWQDALAEYLQNR